jgi:hypothetical protein
MLEPNKKEMAGLNIDFQLSDKERAVLASAIKQEWFDIIQKLMEEEIRLLNVAHINVPADDVEKIVATFRVAKGAAMFYTGFIQRLNEELAIAVGTLKKVGTLENPEEGPSLELEATPHPEE